MEEDNLQQVFSEDIKEAVSSADEEQQSKEKETGLKPLRTYKGDLAQVIGTRKDSVVSIASAESDKRNRGEQNKLAVIGNEKEFENNFTKKVVIIILSTTLIILGTGSVFYFYGKSNTNISEPSSKLSSIIFADDSSEFNITDLSKRQILNGLASIKDSTELSIGRIKNIFITKTFIDEQGIEKRVLVGASDFLNIIDAQAPTSFLRSLKSDIMVGIHVFDGNQPFIVLNTSFYENAFAGMLEWEKYIKEDLSPFFDKTKETKTATFNDSVLKNKDIRILKDENNETVLIYSFINKNTIVITTNENTFGEVLTRLTSSRTLR